MRRARYNFHRTKPMQAMSEINVTSLLDLCFCLLIIFMISTPLIDAKSRVSSANLDLPDGVDGSENTVTQESVSTVSVDKAGQIYWGDKELSQEEFDKLLGSLPESARKQSISIKIDKSNPYQDAITILTTLQKHHFSRVAFDYGI